MEAARAYADAFPSGSDGLLFFGPPDQGKTFAAACIATALDARCFHVEMKSAPEIVYQAKHTDGDWLAPLRSCALLVLDDLGAEWSTQRSREVIYQVVDWRYTTGKPMVVTTNLTRQQLCNPGDVGLRRLYGRILERCLPVEVDNGRRRSTREGYKTMRERLGIA